jgi:hypothetical protein
MASSEMTLPVSILLIEVGIFERYAMDMDRDRAIPKGVSILLIEVGIFEQ